MKLNLEDVKRDFHMNIKWGDSELKAVRYILGCLNSQGETYTEEAIRFFELIVSECSLYILHDDWPEGEELLKKARDRISMHRAHALTRPI